MIKIDFFNGITEDFTVVLANRNLDKQGKISNTSDFVYSGKLNSADEISFNVYKYLDGKKEKLWDDICDLKLIWVNEAKQYFQIKVSKSESNSNVKKVVGVSLCEAELSQTYIRNVEINTEDDIARPDYVVTKFYDPDNYEASLLHRILSIVPHYTIKYVDNSLRNIQRTFSIDDKSIYDFLVGECSEQIGCIFQFDSIDRSISVYDLYTVCQDCGYRGEYVDICPECGSTNLYSFGEDTTILIDSEHLTDEINFETDVDSIKNCFKLKTGDEMMDAAVVACNPNGSDYIYYFSEQQKLDMPDALKEKLDAYEKDGVIAFVEVKTRSEHTAFQPAGAVDAAKRGRIIRAARRWLEENRCALQPRFDVAEVFIRRCKGVIEAADMMYIPSAFDSEGEV